MPSSRSLLILLLTFVSCTDARADLERLQTRYGDITFAALFSLPETKNQFLEIFGNEGWETRSPEELAASIPEAAKRELVRAISSDQLNKTVIKRMEHWILAYYQLRQAQLLTSTEETMAAIYRQKQTRRLFDHIVTNRNMKPDADPIIIGSTLSSAEANELLYRTLNVISDLKAEDQLIYVSNLFATLNDMKN